MNKTNIIVVVGIIGALFIGYDAFVKIPQDKIKTEQDARIQTAILAQAQESIRQTNIQNCLNSDYSDYSQNWDSACSSAELSSNCSLPQFRADILQKIKDNQDSLCMKRY